MELYKVNELSKLAGISVRTLHHYDEIGLLKPAERTRKGYRLYGEDDLLRLQQILFYRELDFPLQEIKSILDAPEFDTVEALRSHKSALNSRKKRLEKLLTTIDKTIAKLEKGTKMTNEELYEGISKERAQALQKEAREQWGSEVGRSEDYLKSLGKNQFNDLKTGFAACWKALAEMSEERQDPHSPEVQTEVAKHYNYILQFWGVTDGTDKRAEQYAGLGQLYKSDSRYTTIDGKDYPEFGEFMSAAMKHFTEEHF